MIATLTRVFTILTADKPTLIREIVVPNLPTTIGNLLNFCAPFDPSFSISEVEILANILEALRDILQSHPVTFRPFAQKTHALILLVLSSSTSSSQEERLARETFALLHLCASGSSRGTTLANADPGSSSSGNKATAVADEWTRGFKAVIQEVHSTLNVLFRSILEDNDYSRSGSFGGQTNGRETTMGATGSSALGLADWNGIMGGVERVTTLLRLLQSFFTLSSAAQVSIPVGQLVDLTTRILSVAPSTAQTNAAVERTERELVFARLPELHRDTLDLISTVVERLGGLFSPFAFLLVEQVAYVFGEASWNAEVRTTVYCLLNSLLDKFGTGLAKATVHSIHPILGATCDDLLPPPPPVAISTPAAKPGKQRNGHGGASGQNFHADAFLSALPAGKFILPGLVSAAEILLATALAKLPTAHIRSELRTKMDRTAVLTGNTEAMLASVLFPPIGARRGGSILPHLVGAGSGHGLVVEGVVRPRLPIVWTGNKKGDAEGDEIESEEEGGDEGESDEDEDEMEVADAHGPSKKSHMEETLAGESPHKRQKTEPKSPSGSTGDQVDKETITGKSNFLDELSVYTRQQSERNSKHATRPVATEISVRATAVVSVSDTTAASSSFNSNTVVSSTSAVRYSQTKDEAGVTKTAAFNGGDSDDDMEIPEIIMGESSSEDEDERGDERGSEDEE